VRVTASTLSRPDLTIGIADDAVTNMMWVSPATSAATAALRLPCTERAPCRGRDLAQVLGLEPVLTAASRRGVVDLARIRLCVRDEILDGVRRERRMRDEHPRHVDDLRHRGQVAQRVYWQLRKHARVDRDRAAVAEEDV
jgi:hypothetical protein